MRRVFEILRRLGLRWALFRTHYLVRLKTGYFQRHLPITSWNEVRLDRLVSDPALGDPAVYLAYRRGRPRCFADGPWTGPRGSNTEEADELLQGRFRLFSHHVKDLGLPPDWHRSALTHDATARDDHWTTFDHFRHGDVKNIWEVNRFGFVYALVRAYRATNDERYPEVFWELLEDWAENNLPNRGINWSCGQETSFRLMAWCFGLEGFQDAAATTPERVQRLAEAVAFSAMRVEVNIDYALIQKNNHGISESVGLWTAGVLFPEFKQAAAWKALGRERLLEATERLVYEDGTYCQFSNNYQRCVLHPLTWVLAISKTVGESWPETFRLRVRDMALYLYHVMEPLNGQAPVTGANDGALVLPLSSCVYEDFRPAIQSGYAASTGRRLLPPGPWDEELHGLRLEVADDLFSPPMDKVQVYPDGGFTILRGTRSRAVIRACRTFKHRPPHADQLHLDFWVDGINVLVDSGSYSYNDPEWTSYFKSVRAHNTVQVDGRDQMWELGRFLYGDWVSVESDTPTIEDNRATWSGHYADRYGCKHLRRITADLEQDTWTIEDEVSGFQQEAILRWRLSPELDWKFSGSTCLSDRLDISVEGGEAALEEGWTSRHYQQRETLQVLAVRCTSSPAMFRTTLALR